MEGELWENMWRLFPDTLLSVVSSGEERVYVPAVLSSAASPRVHHASGRLWVWREATVWPPGTWAFSQGMTDAVRGAAGVLEVGGEVNGK